MRPFADILWRADNPVATAMVLLLSWIATCDGEASDEEIDGLRSLAKAGKNEADLQEVIEIARRGEVGDLLMACQVLRKIEPKNRRVMLQMAVGIALEDGYLTTGESHIVRFVADLLQQSPAELDALFREMTGHPFPPAADPSSIEWWEEREHRQSRRREEQRQSNDARRPGQTAHVGDMSRLRDLAILGLDEGASNEEVRNAYRRLAKVHHPDHFASLGPEAVQAANISFRRIQAAYERLVAT